MYGRRSMTDTLDRMVRALTPEEEGAIAEGILLGR